MAIPVKLEVFEGPLDLLLHLIEKNKVDIYDIPIVTITEQYLDYIKQMETEDMNVMSEFLVMAATLIDIKCRAVGILSFGYRYRIQGDGNGFAVRHLKSCVQAADRKHKEPNQKIGSDGFLVFCLVFFADIFLVFTGSFLRGNRTHIRLILHCFRIYFHHPGMQMPNRRSDSRMYVSFG